MMENRGTGLSPNRVPKEWEKGTLNMTGQPAQGPMVTSRPTSRDLAPGNSVEIAGDFTRDMIAQRPGQVASRALAPFPADVEDVLEQSGAEIYHTFCGGGFTSTDPGDDGNTATGGQGGVNLASGSATRTTGKPIMGQTLGKGTI